MLQKENLDIVSVCTESDTHYEILDAALKSDITLIFCEKPLTEDVASARKIVSKIKEKNVKVAVNHTRRWDPLWSQRASAYIREAPYGKLVSAVGCCSGSIMRDGVHMADLFNMYGIRDLARFVLVPGRYLLFELELFFENARIRILDNGRTIAEMVAEESKHYDNIKELGRTKYEEIPQQSGMYNAVKQLIECVRDPSQEPRCTAEDGLKAVELVSEWLDGKY